MKNILVVNVNWLGDVIFSSPIFKALKEKYPQARLSCLAVPRVKEILESIPYIDEVIIFDEEGKHSNPLGKWQLIAALHKKQFDIVFLLHRSWTRAFMMFLAGIPQRVGYDTKERGIFLTQKVEAKPEPLHRSDYYLNVIKSYGVEVKDQKTFLKVSNESLQEVEQILKSKGVEPKDPIVVIHPGGNWDLKRWPKKNFALLVEKLMAESKAKVVITGGEGDRQSVEDMLKFVRIKPIVLTGEINLKQLMALMKRANVVVSSDSGPLHLATSVGASAIGLFGPTRLEITGPRGIGKAIILQHDVGCNRRACYFLECPDNICMQSISVEEVFNAVRQAQS